MAVINVKYFSELVHQNVEYNVVIPDQLEKSKCKVIYLLHGLYGDAYSWILSGNAIDISNKYNVILIMPDGFNSFYINHNNGYKYYDYIATEVIEHSKNTFNISFLDWYIAGLSMGGFGALYIGLKNDIFKAIGSFSGALEPKKIINDESIIFLKDIANQMNKEHNLLELLNKRKGKYPFIYLYCGRNDSLYKVNKKYSKKMPSYCNKFIFEEDDGTHSWEMWAKCLEKFILNIN